MQKIEASEAEISHGTSGPTRSTATARSRQFGLDIAKVSLGLPIDAYLKRVHDEDKAGLAKAIQHAIATRGLCYAEYRTLSHCGEWTRVMAFGRRFFPPASQSLSFLGIVYLVPLEVDEDVSSIWHLLAAHQIAKKPGNLAWPHRY